MNEFVNKNAEKSNTQLSAFSEFSIGSLLLRMGKITLADAERIMVLHKEKGVKFGEAAKSLGLVSDADIQEVLSRQFDYPYLITENNNYSHELVMAYQPFGKKAEVYRSIRTQLMMNWFSDGKKVLSATAVNSGDGTSVFLANLAIVFSQLGERTLLVDANLRAPSQHTLFNLEEKRGLSDILAGRVGANVVASVNAFENLSILGAGTIPPNPHELVSRPAFKALIAELVLQYDVILFDAPACSVGSDIYTISSALGGVVVVTKKDSTKLKDAEMAMENFMSNGVRVIGTILLDF